MTIRANDRETKQSLCTCLRWCYSCLPLLQSVRGGHRSMHRLSQENWIQSAVELRFVEHNHTLPILWKSTGRVVTRLYTLNPPPCRSLKFHREPSRQGGNLNYEPDSEAKVGLPLFFIHMHSLFVFFVLLQPKLRLAQSLWKPHELWTSRSSLGKWY